MATHRSRDTSFTQEASSLHGKLRLGLIVLDEAFSFAGLGAFVPVLGGSPALAHAVSASVTCSYSTDITVSAPSTCGLEAEGSRN